MAVQSRGWTDLVRVCNNCRDELLKNSENGDPQGEHKTLLLGKDIEYKLVFVVVENAEEEAKVRVRKYGEAIANTLSQVASVACVAKDFVKDSARPAYWVPDHLSPKCVVCNVAFGNAEDHDKTHLLYKSSAFIETTNKVDSGGSSANTSPSHHNAQRPALGNDIKRHHCRH